jgi:hypothetical protein
MRVGEHRDAEAVSVTQNAVRARRPRDRRGRIIAAAAEQFRASGYHNVGIVEIAEVVGITRRVVPPLRRQADVLLSTAQDAINRLGAMWDATAAG